MSVNFIFKLSLRFIELPAVFWQSKGFSSLYDKKQWKPALKETKKTIYEVECLLHVPLMTVNPSAENSNGDLSVLWRDIWLYWKKDYVGALSVTLLI